MDEEASKVKAMALTAYGFPLATAPSFKYMDSILSTSYYYCPAEFNSLRKVQKKWAQLLHLMVRDRAYDRKLGLFYVVVLKAVLLYGS